MTPKSQAVDPKYELPKLVDSFVTGWLGTLGSGSLASTVLASVATALFVHIQEQMKFPQTTPPYPLLASAVDTPRGNALLVFAYLGIIINCNATITAFLISDKIAETPFTSAENDYRNVTKRVNTQGSAEDVYPADGMNALFVEHSKWETWHYYTVYWAVAQFLGVICIFIELMLYLWILEGSLAVKVPVTVALGLSLLPVLTFLGTGFGRIIKAYAG